MRIKGKSTIKNGFYKKYAEEIKKQKPAEAHNDKVIVINQNEKENLLATIFNGIGSVFRVVVYVVVFVLSSIGLTAIFNEEIREMLWDLIIKSG